MQHGFHDVAKDCRPATIKLLGQGQVVTRGVLVEEPAQIEFAHCGSGFAGAKPRQLQARAVTIIGVGAACLGESRNRALAVAETAAQCGKSKPGSGESRRCRYRLRQDVRRTGKVAACGEIHRRVRR